MKPHGRNLRRGRFSEVGRIYLVTTVTHQRRPVFADWRLGRMVVRCLQEAEHARCAYTLAYVVMPDHLHWLFSLAEGEELSRLVGWVKGHSSRRVAQQLGFSPIWQAGFHDHAARAEEDIPDLARYVVANPLRAGLVKRLGDYPLWDAIYL